MNRTDEKSQEITKCPDLFDAVNTCICPILYIISINSANTVLKAKLTLALSLLSPWAAQSPCCYQGTNWKPFDCVVIALQVYLPMLCHYSAFTCITHCQERAPSFSEQYNCLELSQSETQNCRERLALTFASSLKQLTRLARLGFDGRFCLPYSGRWAIPCATLGMWR